MAQIPRKSKRTYSLRLSSATKSIPQKRGIAFVPLVRPEAVPFGQFDICHTLNSRTPFVQFSVPPDTSGLQNVMPLQ